LQAAIPRRSAFGEAVCKHSRLESGAAPRIGAIRGPHSIPIDWRLT